MNNQSIQPTISQTPPPTGEAPVPQVIVTPPKPPERKKILLALGGLIFTAIVAVSLLGFYFFYARRPKPPSWHNLTPGFSTRADVIRELGTPQAEKEFPVSTGLLYPSDFKVFPNTIVLDEKSVIKSIFVQVPAEEPIKFSDWIKQYGKPEKEMYNSYAACTKTYIFAKRGVAVVANQELNQIYSIHYFIPTSLEDYLTQWGNYLFEENPYMM